MVEVANRLNGWTQNVYKFGCAFIHLSNFHNYLVKDPCLSLKKEDKEEIIKHIKNYHMITLRNDFSLEDIFNVLPSIMDKIHKNLECEIETLEKNK